MCLRNDEFIFLTKEQILKIHDSSIKEFGGKEGISNNSLLESALYQPQCSFDGKYLYESIYEKAAAYLISFVKDHPFIDGNKRTGLKACLIFLEMNNHKLLLNNDEAIDLTTKCVTGEYSRDDIVKIILENTI